MTQIRPQADRPVKMHALTSLRFFAALYVIFYHYRWGVIPGGSLDRILSCGFISVEFFFLLSGYILAVVYLRSGRTVRPRTFQLARFARIYPLYLVSVLLDVPNALSARIPAYGLHKAIERVAVLFAASSVMMQMWVPVLKIINIPSWSLSIETAFYISFPILGLWLWKFSSRAVIIAAIIFYAGSIVLNQWLNIRIPDHLYGLDLVSYMAIFSLGILLARWEVLHIERRNSEPASRKMIKLVLAISCILFAFSIYFSPWLSQKNLHVGLLLAPVFAAVIWSLSSTNTALVRLLSIKPLVLLGEASYGLYLLHVPIEHLFRRFHLTGSPYDYPLYLSTSIGLSILSFYVFETPSRRWITERFRVRNPETMEAASNAQ